MPYEVRRSKACPGGKPWAVKKKGGTKIFGCHASRQSANRQLAALYANEKR